MRNMVAAVSSLKERFTSELRPTMLLSTQRGPNMTFNTLAE